MAIFPRSAALSVTMYTLAAVVLFAGGFTLSDRYGVELRIRKASRLDPASIYTPRWQSDTGPQLVMIYFGSAGCAWSNQPGLSEAVEALKMRLAGFAEQQSMGFKAVGVAFDWDLESGVDHLRKYGRFDEIATGSHWGNTLAMRYLWPDESLSPNTPQVVVYKRLFTTPADSTARPSFSESDLELLSAASGLDQILEWARSEATLPDKMRAANET